MTANPSPEAVKLLAVEQVDRDAAAAYANDAGWGAGSVYAIEGHADMEHDELRLVQAFAAHRLASSEKLAEVEAERDAALRNNGDLALLYANTEDRALAAEARCDALQLQLDEARGVMQALLTHSFADECQECAIGHSEAWKRARDFLARATKEDGDG